MVQIIAGLVCVACAAINVPFFPTTANVIAFIFCLTLAGVNFGMAIAVRRN